MHICPAHGLLEYQKQLDSDLFWAGDGRSCGIFQPFSTLAHETRLTTFLIVPNNFMFVIVPNNFMFEGASFEVRKTWQIWSTKIYKVFMKPCYLLDWYTIATP